MLRENALTVSIVILYLKKKHCLSYYIIWVKVSPIHLNECIRNINSVFLDNLPLHSHHLLFLFVKMLSQQLYF